MLSTHTGDFCLSCFIERIKQSCLSQFALFCVVCTSFIGQPGAVNSYWVQTSLCSRNNQGKNLGTNERLFHQTNLMICFLFNLCTEKKEGKISINKSDEQPLCLCMIVLSLS